MTDTIYTEATKATEATSETAEEKNKKTKCGIWEILIIVFLSAIVFVSVVLAIDIGNTTVRWKLLIQLPQFGHFCRFSE